MLSIIIPSRNERFLAQTVSDIFAKAGGDIEVIVILDGYWPDPILPDRPNLVLLHRGRAKGMRAGINAGAALAKGEFLMKCDAHCMFDEGFDLALAADCDKDWLVIPRRKRLDAENWMPRPDREDIDYEFLSYPFWKPAEPGIHGTVWNERIRERRGKPEFDIDDNMAFQGSCWFMPREYFWHFGGMQEAGYGTFIGEPQELGMKVWLSGGRLIVNKKTWYAHLHKGKQYGRGYSISKNELIRGNLYSVDYWYNDRWPDRIHDFEWLIEKFWPVPTWPGMDRSQWQPLGEN